MGPCISSYVVIRIVVGQFDDYVAPNEEKITRDFCQIPVHLIISILTNISLIDIKTQDVLCNTTHLNHRCVLHKGI